MPFNGTGTFTLNYNWENDAANGIPITASRMDAQEADIANGLSTVITTSGQSTITANIPMDGFKFTGLGNPSVSGDSIRYAGPAVLTDVTLLGVLTAPTISGVTDFTSQITGPDTGYWNGSGLNGVIIGNVSPASAQFSTLSVGAPLLSNSLSSVTYTSTSDSPLSIKNTIGFRWDLGDGVNSPTGSFGFSCTGNGGIVPLRMNGSGAIQFPVYGAGTLNTDASGNIFAASDPSLKNKIGDFTKGLTEIKAIAADPKYMGNFHWVENSGMETAGTYTSFFAYDDFPISEAISKTKIGINSFSDRPVIMALVNAVAALEARLAAVEAK